MGTVVLRLIVSAPLTAFEEPTLGNRSPQGSGGETMGNEIERGFRDSESPDGIERRQNKRDHTQKYKRGKEQMSELEGIK